MEQGVELLAVEDARGERGERRGRAVRVEATAAGFVALHSTSARTSRVQAEEIAVAVQDSRSRQSLAFLAPDPSNDGARARTAAHNNHPVEPKSTGSFRPQPAQ